MPYATDCYFFSLTKTTTILMMLKRWRRRNQKPNKKLRKQRPKAKRSAPDARGGLKRRCMRTCGNASNVRIVMLGSHTSQGIWSLAKESRLWIKGKKRNALSARLGSILSATFATSRLFIQAWIWRSTDNVLAGPRRGQRRWLQERPFMKLILKRYMINWVNYINLFETNLFSSTLVKLSH